MLSHWCRQKLGQGPMVGYQIEIVKPNPLIHPLSDPGVLPSICGVANCIPCASYIMYDDGQTKQQPHHAEDRDDVRRDDILADLPESVHKLECSDYPCESEHLHQAGKPCHPIQTSRTQHLFGFYLGK